MMLIPAWHVAIAFLLAALVKLKTRQYEHVFTRLMVFVVYGYFSFVPELSENDRQLLARWFFVLLGLTESVSYFLREVVKRGNS